MTNIQPTFTIGMMTSSVERSTVSSWSECIEGSSLATSLVGCSSSSCYASASCSAHSDKGLCQCFSSVSVQGCDGCHELLLVSIFRDSSIFAVDTGSSMEVCLAEDKLCLEDLLVCSATCDIGSTLVGLVVS